MTRVITPAAVVANKAPTHNAASTTTCGITSTGLTSQRQRDTVGSSRASSRNGYAGALDLALVIK